MKLQKEESTCLDLLGIYWLSNGLGGKNKRVNSTQIALATVAIQLTGYSLSAVEIRCGQKLRGWQRGLKFKSEADIVMLREIDLAKLSLYEQARELSLDLLKQWLVKYKFKNWATHESDSQKKGQPVTEDEKIDRAREIAEILSDNAKWHAHGRYIDIQRLQELGLKIEDYSKNDALLAAVRAYHDTLAVYARRVGRPLTLHHQSVGIQGVTL